MGRHQLWEYDTKGAVSVASPLLSPDGSHLFIGSTSWNFTSLDAVTGRRRWTHRTSYWITGSPAFSPVPGEDLVYIGSEVL